MSDAFTGDFESGMERLMEGELEWFARLMQTMTRYFTQFRTDGSGQNLYSQFLLRLAESSAFHQTILSTLNYECVLEYGANEIGWRVAYNLEMPMPQNVRIWKLHGSCNFIPHRQALTIGRGMRFDSSCQFEVPIEIVSPREARGWVDGDTALYSAMCMYAHDKPSQVSPAMFNEIRAIWARIVQQAERIVVIGARPNMADTHIWSPLARSGAILYFVGERAAFESWQRDHRRGPAFWLGDTFEACLDRAVGVLTSQEPVIGPSGVDLPGSRAQDVP